MHRRLAKSKVIAMIFPWGSIVSGDDQDVDVDDFWVGVEIVGTRPVGVSVG